MSLKAGAAVQLRVIHALILRETRTRYGKFVLGYLWAYIVPWVFVLIFYTMFVVVGRQTPYGMDVVGFLATGIFPYLMFRQTRTRTLGSINSNKALLFYPQVMPIDLVVARSILEFATFLPVFGSLLIFGAAITGHFEIDDPLVTLVGLVGAWLLGATVGFVFCGLTVFYPSLDNLVTPVMRPMLWLSGIFFTANELPSGIRDLLLWNPLLHAVELTRDGRFPLYTAHYADPIYVVKWVLGMAFVGLILERVARRKILA